MRFKPPNSPKLRARFLALILLIITSVAIIQPAYAGTYVGYTSANVLVNCTNTGQAHCSGSGTPNTIASGDSLQAPFAGTLVSILIHTGLTLPTHVVIATFTSGATPARTNTACTNDGTHTCPFDNSGQSGYTVQDTEALSGLSTQADNSVNLNSPVTVAIGQWVAVVFLRNDNGGVPLQTCDTSCGTAFTSAVVDTSLSFSTAFSISLPSVGQTPTTSGQTGGCGCVIGGTFNPAGASIGSVTQCYGNCGTPAITLANTNSTHSVNFNNSITLFYEFQSNINGFLLNVTTNMAKSYVNSNGPWLGVYLVSTSCPIGETPFSSTCPGSLVQGPFAPINPVKGRVSMANLRIPVSNGQWVGIALSAYFSPLDVNDTNTNVAMFQTNGRIPAVISVSSSFNSASKVGLWAWINGNVVTGTPPSSPPFATCGPGLDCILTQVVNFSCTVVTQACQTGASIFWIIILTIISLGVLLYFMGEVFPGVNVGRAFSIDFAVLIFLGWFALFASFSLVAPWLVILVFLTTAWLFVGKARGSGPI